MRRKTLIGGPGFAASASGALLFGILGWLVLPAYPATGIVLMIAATVALTGLALRWRRRLRLHRIIEKSE